MYVRLRAHRLRSARAKRQEQERYPWIHGPIMCYFCRIVAHGTRHKDAHFGICPTCWNPMLVPAYPFLNFNAQEIES